MNRRQRIVFGWCFGWLVLVLAAASVAVGAERLSVSVSKANVRSGPGIDDYDILWEVERYHPVEVVEKTDGWVLFTDFEGDRGWIHGQLLGTEPTVITKKDNCNVRGGPGTDTDVVFRAERGVPFKVIEKKDEWIHIQSSGGDRGWIHRALVW